MELFNTGDVTTGPQLCSSYLGAHASHAHEPVVDFRFTLSGPE